MKNHSVAGTQCSKCSAFVSIQGLILHYDTCHNFPSLAQEQKDAAITT